MFSMVGHIEDNDSLVGGHSLINNIIDIFRDNDHVAELQPTNPTPPNSLITTPPSLLELRQNNPQDCQNLIIASVDRATVEISRTIIALNATFSQQLQQASISASNGIKSAENSATSTISVVVSSASVVTSAAFSSLTLANRRVESVNTALTSAQAIASQASSSLVVVSSSSSSDVSTLSVSLSLALASLTAAQASASAALSSAQATLTSATGAAAKQAASILASAARNTVPASSETSIIQPAIFLTPPQIAGIITGAVVLVTLITAAIWFLLTRLRSNQSTRSNSSNDSYLDEKIRPGSRPRNLRRNSSNIRTGMGMVLRVDPRRGRSKGTGIVSRDVFDNGDVGDERLQRQVMEVERDDVDQEFGNRGQWPLMPKTSTRTDQDISDVPERMSGWPLESRGTDATLVTTPEMSGAITGIDFDLAEPPRPKESSPDPFAVAERSESMDRNERQAADDPFVDPIVEDDITDEEYERIVEKPEHVTQELLDFRFPAEDMNPFVDRLDPEDVEQGKEFTDDLISPRTDFSLDYEGQRLNPGDTKSIASPLSRDLGETTTTVEIEDKLLPPEREPELPTPSPSSFEFPFTPQPPPVRTPNPEILALLNPSILPPSQASEAQARTSTMPEIDLVLKEITKKNEILADKPLFWTDFRAVEPEFVAPTGLLKIGNRKSGDALRDKECETIVNAGGGSEGGRVLSSGSGVFGDLDGFEEAKILSPFGNFDDKEMVERIEREERSERGRRLMDVLRANSPVPVEVRGLERTGEEVGDGERGEGEAETIQEEVRAELQNYREDEEEEEALEWPLSLQTLVAHTQTEQVLDPEPMSTAKVDKDQQTSEARPLQDLISPGPATSSPLIEPELGSAELAAAILQSLQSPTLDVTNIDRDISPLRRNPQIRNITSLLAESHVLESVPPSEERQERGRSMLRTSDIISARNSTLSLLKRQSLRQGTAPNLEHTPMSQEHGYGHKRSSTLSPLRLNPILRGEIPRASYILEKRNASTPPLMPLSIPASLLPMELGREESPLRRNLSNPPPSMPLPLSTSLVPTNPIREESPLRRNPSRPPLVKQSDSFSQNLSIFQNLAKEGKGKEASNEVTSRAIQGIYIPGSLREMDVRGLSVGGDESRSRSRMGERRG